MKIFLYFPESQKRAGKIRQVIERLIPPENMEIHRDIGSFIAGSRAWNGHDNIAVLLPEENRDLLRIAEVCGHLHSVRIILILPDRKEETITMGHRLYPRFLTFADCNPEVIAAVLGKMIVNRNTNL